MLCVDVDAASPNGVVAGYVPRVGGINEERDMLILTRRVGETLMIGDEVTVTVLGVKGNQVRIGVNAPKSVSVHREEIYERIRQEREGQTSEQDGTVE